MTNGKGKTKYFKPKLIFHYTSNTETQRILLTACYFWFAISDRVINIKYLFVVVDILIAVKKDFKYINNCT